MSRGSEAARATDARTGTRRAHFFMNEVAAAPYAPTLAPEKQAVSRQEFVVVVFAAALALLVHAHFRLSGFGEQDAARIAKDAIVWHVSHSITYQECDYRLRTSPLYIHGLKVALDRGLPIRALPKVMNGFSVVLSSVCLGALYFLFRRVTAPRVAAAATIIYALTPGFWLGSIYGMPHLPSLCFWVLSLLAFTHAAELENKRQPRFVALIALTGLAAFVAMALKADIILCGGAFLAVVLWAGSDRRLLATAGVVSLGLAGGAALIYPKLLVRAAAPEPGAHVDPGAIQFLQTWQERFPFQLKALLDPKNTSPIFHSVGMLIFGLIVIALLHAWVSGGQRARFALLAALWGLPPILFWGLSYGNSARHNVPAFPPLVLVATLFLFEIAATVEKAYTLIGSILVLSYFASAGGGGPVVPRSDLVELSRGLEASTRNLHQEARNIALRPEPKKVVIDGIELVYTEFETYAAAKSPVFAARPRSIRDGEQQTLLVSAPNLGEARRLARQYRQSGWEVFSLRYRI
jgi:Dolichyl-phosphate-mannose-protein mannosyltransferase